MDKSEDFAVFLMVALLAFAVVIVDERLLRTAVAVLPALWLAQRALRLSALASSTEGETAPDRPAGEAGQYPNRRMDDEVRGYIDRLLKHFREFYTTCHLVGANVLTPEAAEERAANLEKELNKLLAEVTEVTRARGASPGE